MSFEVRQATPDDADEMAQVLNDALQQKLRHGDNVWGDEPFQASDAMQRIQTGNAYVAYVDSRVAGTVLLLWDDPGMWGQQSPDAGYIHGLAVSERFRGQKVGERILSWAAGQVARAGRDFLRLDCPAVNEGLCAYYENLGFIKIDEKPNPRHPDETSAYFEKPV